MITREWRHPGLSIQLKRTPNEETKNQKTPRDGKKTRRTRRMDKGQGDKERNTNPSGLTGDWFAGRCRQGRSGYEGNGGRQREGGTLGRENS